MRTSLLHRLIAARRSTPVAGQPPLCSNRADRRRSSAGPPAGPETDAGPSLDFGYCDVPFGGPGTTKLAGRTWSGGQVAVTQEVHYDPTLRGAAIVAGLRQGAGTCDEYPDRVGFRNRLQLVATAAAAALSNG